MKNLNELRSFIAAENPELNSVVNKLTNNDRRLSRILSDLARLDEALIVRALMLSSSNTPKDSMAADLIANFIGLLTTISTFIGTISVEPEERAKQAINIYDELMTRIMEKKQ